MSAAMQAGIGGAAWVAFVVTRGGESWVHALALFAALMLMPLVGALLADEEEEETVARWLAWSRRAGLPAALCAVGACWAPSGVVAGALALPWVAVTGLLAAAGWRRLRRDGWRRELDGVGRDAAMIFALGGAIALALERVGVGGDARLAGELALTGVALPLFAGLAQRELFFQRLASRALVGVALGVPVTAVGAVMTRIGWGASVETAAGCGLALAGMAVAVLHVRLGLEGRGPVGARLALAMAGVALFVAMAFTALQALRGSAAMASALGSMTEASPVGGIAAMAFGLCGALGWRRLPVGATR